MPFFVQCAELTVNGGSFKEVTGNVSVVKNVSFPVPEAVAARNKRPAKAKTTQRQGPNTARASRMDRDGASAYPGVQRTEEPSATAGYQLLPRVDQSTAAQNCRAPAKPLPAPDRFSFANEIGAQIHLNASKSQERLAVPSSSANGSAQQIYRARSSSPVPDGGGSKRSVAGEQGVQSSVQKTLTPGKGNKRSASAHNRQKSRQI